MAEWDDSHDSDWEGSSDTFEYDLNAHWPSEADPAEIFFGLIRELQDHFHIRKAVLILKEKVHSRFCAVATFHEGRMRKNLSLRLPGHSSLFQKVADHRAMYTETFCDLFSGNTFERNLLLDDDCRSYAMIPLLHDGSVVGILGFSSDDPTTFVTFENGAVDGVVTQFSERVGRAVSVSE